MLEARNCDSWHDVLNEIGMMMADVGQLQVTGQAEENEGYLTSRYNYSYKPTT